MLIVETIAKIRRAYRRDKKPNRESARDMNLSRNAVREIVRTDVTEQRCERKRQLRPKLESYKDQLIKSLEEVQDKLPKQRRTALLMFEMLQHDGFAGGYDRVRRFVASWRGQTKGVGEAFLFSWSYEPIESIGLGGNNVKIKLKRFCLCHSRAPFCVVCMRESLEMVLDAHVQAFEFYA